MITAWDEGRISPPWSEIEDHDRFLPPLVPGERELARFLDERLDPAWRIYVRPHLDADRPILAAIHPEHGGIVWDVVPWHLEDARVDDGIWVVPIEGLPARFVSPMMHLDRVRAKLYGTYLPQLAERIDDGSLRFSLVRAGLYFPEATTARVRELVGAQADRKAMAVFGHDALVADRLPVVVGAVPRARTMQPGWFEAFDAVLGHAHRQPDAMAAIRLTRAQQPLARPSSGTHVIDGVAGSGKSTVLAYRAVRIAESGRRVLVLTFNRTLTNYLRALISRVPIRWRRDRISVMHFHELLRLVHAHHSLRPSAVGDEDAPDGELDHVLEHIWPAETLRVLEELGVPDELRFDAVVIDEGQDFSPAYAKVIERLLPADAGEIVIAHDRAQRVYGRPSVLTDPSHSWSHIAPTHLRQGVRLPAGTAAVATHFAEIWSLPTLPIQGREPGLLPDADGPFVVPANDRADAAAGALAVLERWRAEPGHLPARVAVLVPSRDFGIAFVRLLAEAGISTNHVFPVRRTGAELEVPIDGDGRDWLIERTQKNAFAVDDARLKVSTIHSFKGWDAERVIFVVPPSRRAPDERAIAAIYVGMTRAEGEAVFVVESGAYGLHELGLPELRVTSSPAMAARFEELLGQVHGHLGSLQEVRADGG